MHAPDTGFGQIGGGTTVTPKVTVEQLERQGVGARLRPHTSGVLGDQIDPNTGSLRFTHSDVSIPGNSRIPVEIVRYRKQGLTYYPDVNIDFGDWELDIPKISVLIGQRTENGVATEPPVWSAARCTSSAGTQLQAKYLKLPTFPLPPSGDSWAPGVFIQPEEYSNGLQLHVPGQGARTLTQGSIGNQWRSDTTWATTDNWAISCIADIGSASGGGEGFTARSPDGLIYTFDRLVYREATWLNVGPTYLSRHHAIMLGTRVEDEHGNWVQYSYDSNARLTQVTSNDGRAVTLTYQGSSKLIDSVTANGRTWNYDYKTIAGIEQHLDKVTLPDSRFWSFDMTDMRTTPSSGVSCSVPNQNVNLTHPDGISGAFVLKETKHGRTRVPTHWDISVGACLADNPEAEHSYFEAISVFTKTLVGPGYPNSTWTYTYQQDEGNFANSPDNMPDTRWTQVVDPEGHKTIYEHNRRVSDLENLLVQVERFETAGSSMPTQAIAYTYDIEAAIGTSIILSKENDAIIVKPRHQDVVTTTRGSDVYTTDYGYNSNIYSSSYSYGLPTSISRSNNFSINAISDAISYVHNKTHWKIALPSSVTKNGELFENVYYDTLGRPYQQNTFGSLNQKIGYHPVAGYTNQKGTVAWVEDALGNRWTFDYYKRGIVGLIRRPNATYFSRSIDDNGWVTGETDWKGNRTNYSYNSVGRLSLIDPPTNDGISRLDTTITYSMVSSSDLSMSGAGLVSGQWKQQISRGTLRTTNYLDAMLRPILMRTQDTTDSTLDRWSRTSFDSENRPTFASFPASTPTATTGTAIEYDSLGRIIENRENVPPYAETSYQYMTNNRVRTTNPRLKQTTTTFYALDTPSTDLPTLIQQPEGVTTTIARNNLGEMTTANQSGGGTSVTRTYRYDSKHRLCRRIDPESGHTVFNYDAAGRPAWFAKAARRRQRRLQSLLSSNWCANSDHSRQYW